MARRRWGWLRAAAMAVLLMGSAAPAAAQGQRDAVLALDFVGVERFPLAQLRAAIVTTATRCLTVQPLCFLGVGVQEATLDPVQLQMDRARLELFYYQRGYRESTVSMDTLRVPDGMRVRFTVQEGRPVRLTALEVQGPDSLVARIGADLPLQPGDPLNLVAHEAARDTLVARLAELGYARAEVLANYAIPVDAPLTATVRYELVADERMRFGAIRVEGAERVAASVVRRMLTFSAGDLYRRSAVLRSQRNLFGLDVFQHAEILTDRGAWPDTVVGVTVRVNEGNLYRVRAGLGVNTSEYVTGEGRWTARNFLGGARRLEVSGRMTNLLATPLGFVPGIFEETEGIYRKPAGSLSLDFAQPWFFDPANTLGVGVFLERRSIPDVFVRQARGGYVTFTRALGSDASVALGYRPELTQIDSEGDLIYCLGFTACGEEEIAILRAAHWLAPFTLSFARDRANSIFAPTRGYVLRADGEWAAAATGSEFAYARLSAELAMYRGVGRGVVLAGRVRPGWSHAIEDPAAGLGVHPQKRFFGGGANSVRGFAQYRMGPKLLTVNAARDLVESIEGVWVGCTPASINSGTCDPAPLVAARPDLFDLRPVGGAVALEANAELRFPLYGEKVGGAAFVDFGNVWQEEEGVRLDDVVWTPGAGVRYFSPIGPVRVDVGYNSQGVEHLQVVTTAVCVRAAVGECVAPDGALPQPDGVVENRRALRPLGSAAWAPFDRFWDRLQIHFSIGQAF
ncbi:MAG: BamA/TamA family outer membrane protein [Gemmatimonadota bacterium]